MTRAAMQRDSARSTGPRRAPAVRLLLLVALAAGCADFEAAAPNAAGLRDTLVAVPAFAADIQPMLTARCATGGCHNLATSQAGLNLARGYAYDALVDVPSVYGAPLDRVEPGNAVASFLVHAIQAPQAPRGILPRMPLGREPLTDNQIQTIVNWIGQGAPRN
jgi:hypothetical protein